MDLTKLYDRSNPEKWAHPDLEEGYGATSLAQKPLKTLIWNFDVPREERAAASQKQKEAMAAAFAAMPIEKVMIPGCPEEPDAPELELLVFHPAEPAKNKLPVVLACPGGGLYVAVPEIHGYLANRLGCIVVAPRYRTAFEAKYPAALNDCHAAYQYVVEHAAELGANPKKIVLAGVSSGSHLAISLAFRLKRYGYHPRGCVVESSILDNRAIYSTSTIDTGNGWDAFEQFGASVEYLGLNNITKAHDPEMYPVYATPEQCVGLCPIFIHAEAEDACSGASRAFIDQLSQAGVYHELHVWGGTCHGVLPVRLAQNEDTPYAKAYGTVVLRNIQDCFDHDLTRSWIVDAVNEG